MTARATRGRVLVAVGHVLLSTRPPSGNNVPIIALLSSLIGLCWARLINH